MAKEFGSGDGLGSSSYASGKCAASIYSSLIDGGGAYIDWDSVGNLDLPPLKEMDSRLSTSPPRQCGRLASENYPTSVTDRPRGEGSASKFSRSNNGSRVNCNPVRHQLPSSHGGPEDIGNYVAAMTGNYLQHSSLSTSTLVHTPFSFLKYRWTGEGLSKGKQPLDKGKDLEGTGGRRPGPGTSHAVGRPCVEKTNAVPFNASPAQTEITPDDFCPETIVGAKPPAQSRSRKGKKQLLGISACHKVRSRSEDWSEFEDQILLSVKKKQSMLGSSETPGKSWSWPASEVLNSVGSERTQKACQQRWDTLFKNFKAVTQLQKTELQLPPAFKNWEIYQLMQTMAPGDDQKQQSPENDTCTGGQTVDATARLPSLLNNLPEFSAGPSNANGPCSLDSEVEVSAKLLGHGLSSSAVLAAAQEIQVPKVSSHDPHMIEMVRHVLLPAFQEMEENMMSSQKAWMAAFSTRLDTYWQEVKIIKEMLLVGESPTRVVANSVASTGQEQHAYHRPPNQDASPSSTFWSGLLNLDDVLEGKFIT